MTTDDVKPQSVPAKLLLADIDNRLVNIAWAIHCADETVDMWTPALDALELPHEFLAARHQLEFDHRRQCELAPLMGVPNHG